MNAPHRPAPPAALETERLDIRSATPDDVERLQRVFTAAGDHFLTVTGRPQPDPDAAEREIRGSQATPGRDVAIFTLRETGEDVGAAGWWSGSPEPDVALLGMLTVDVAHRRTGIAREALAALEVWLAGHGVRRIRSGVGAGDEKSQEILRGLGFAPLDERRHVALDRGRVMIALFEKEIG
ncbi:MAG TPA: GNAT family N-acetyltransferase [Longimicrobiaceae bacterium]|nr:GNAT family N-acetyltransferase [Longimicrobiaceae bacterium]